jgi:hypothetical protein
MKTSLLFCFCLVLVSCKQDPYSPAQYLSDTGVKRVIRETIRYSTKLPPGATHENKFDPEFNQYYQLAEKEYDLRAWFPADTVVYFLMTRQARSVTPMREGIGGKIKYGKDHRLVFYEEVFRTWKMPDSLLNIRGRELFKAMVEGKDLTPYTAKYRGDQYIEFPDDRFYFDKAELKWRDKIFDSLRVENKK